MGKYVWLNRWNYQKQKYIPYKIPEEWNVILFTDNMDLAVNCTNCGKAIRYGDSYTSLEIHGNGFGFPVCQSCYKEELERRKEYDLLYDNFD